MQWTLKSPTARSFEGKWSPKVRPPYKDPEDLEDDIPLVFRKPSWQLRACLASVLITSVLYRLYLIMVTIGYVLFSNKPCQTFSPPPRPACPVVDLSWTGVFPCELGWRGSALAVLILSAVLITCYSLITACLVRWNTRKQLNIQLCTTSVFETPEKATKFQVRVQSTNRLMLLPSLSLCIMLLIFRLLLQSGDIEANPGPTLGSILTLDDLNSVYKNLIKAAGNWFNLGLDLGLGFDILDNIKDKYRDNQTCLRDMLAARLKTATLTYSEVCRSLRASTVERNDVAEAIEENCKDDDTSSGSSKKQKLSTANPGLTKPITIKRDGIAEAIEKECTDDNILPGPSKRPKRCPIQMYRTYLISTYNVKQLPADNRYPLDCVKQFINLKIVDDRDQFARSEFQTHEVNGKIDRVDKGPVCIEQIACKIDDSFPKLIIIKGAPGVGKTTLSWELCRRWSLGDIWRDYSLVVLLRLRDKSTHEAKNLVDLFECGDEATSHRVKEELLITQGKGLLFILEGLDEFPQAFRKTENCIIMRLIHGKLLPASTVVITTRPWALDSFGICSSRIDQKIVVLGFTGKQIQEYIDQAIKHGVPDGLQTYIAANPHINSAMYNPLYARIVVQVYIEYCHCRKQNVFPNTTTELYTAYSTVLLKRYLADHPVKEKWNGELHELPQSLQPHFLHLCQIAHKGIVQNENQLIFYEDDIPEGSTTLGFMNSVHPLYQSITKTASPSFNFIHLTLQEFLAAIHIWRTYSQQDQLLFIEARSKKYNMIILFLAGLTKFSDRTKCVLPAPRVRSSDNEMIVYFRREHILWLYETQNEQLISSFDNVVLPIQLMQSQLDPLYFLALGYCIAVGKFMLKINISNPWVIGWEPEDGTEIFIQINLRHLLAGLKRHNSKCSSVVKFLDIELRCIPTISLPFDILFEIINYIPAATQGVLYDDESYEMELASKVSKFIVNAEMVTTPYFLDALKNSSTLKILRCRINRPLSASETDAIIKLCTSLEYLEVTISVGYTDDSDDDSDYSESVKHSDTQRLVFGLNIKRFKELKRRQLFPLNFGPIDMGDFIKQAKKFIDHFADYLKYFGLFDDGPLCSNVLKHSVSHSLSKCPLLERLEICSDIPKPKSLQNSDCFNLESIIFKALEQSSSLRELCCSMNFTSDEIVNEFCVLLQKNTSLEEIKIWVCDGIILHNYWASQQITRSFSDVERPAVSSTFLKQIMEIICSLKLKKLNIILDFRGHDGQVIANNDTIVAICNLLENNKYLECLHLPKMYMEPRQRFLLPIANALSKNSSLTTLILDFEPTKREFSKPCYEFLLINSEDSKAVGDMLKVNKTLRFLHLMVAIPDWSPIIEGLKLNTTIRELHIPSSAKKSSIKCIDYVHVRSRIKYPREYN